MNEVSTFDPSSATTGTFNTGLPIQGKFVVFNESNIGLKLTFSDGSSGYVPSWTCMIFSQPTPDPVVTWSQQNILGGSPGPISQVTIETYQAHEKISGVYPFALIRQITVGNTVDVTVPTSTSLQNDNNTAGTVFIESTESGSPTSNVSVNNSGDMWIGEWTGGVFTKNFQVVDNAAVPVLLGAVGKTVETLGKHQIDDNIIGANTKALQWKDSGGTPRDVLNVDSANDVNIVGITGKDLLQLVSSAGAVVGTFDMILKAMTIATTAVSVAGTTNGTAYLYMPFVGTNFKLAILRFDAYRNASASEQTIALPAAFTTRALFQTGNGKACTPYSGGSALVNKTNVITALAAGGGTISVQSLIPSYSLGEIVNTFDAIGLGVSQASNATAIYVFVGL